MELSLHYLPRRQQSIYKCQPNHIKRLTFKHTIGIIVSRLYLMEVDSLLMKKLDVRMMALAALFAALSGVLSQITIPIGPVPINLTHVAIFTAVGILGTKYGVVSQIVFVALGAVGVPVFSGFTGGVGIIAGPTGGFIIGYIGCALATGLMVKWLGKSIKALIISMYVGWLVTYLMGAGWYMWRMDAGLVQALVYCVVPFLLGDIPKTILSAVLVNRIGVAVKAGQG